MTIQRIDVDDSFVDIALGACEALLDSKNEESTIDELRNSVPINREANGKRIHLRLTDQQRRFFERDFERPTPLVAYPDIPRPLTRFGLLQLALATSMGIPYSITEQKSSLIHDVLPQSDLIERSPSALGARVPLHFHTDQAGNLVERIPDTTLLGCIRNGERAGTIITSLDDVVNLLDDETLDLLKASRFYFDWREDFGLRTTPVLFDGEHGMRTNISINMSAALYPLDFNAETAFRVFLMACEHFAERVVLEQGEFLAVSNWNTPHARLSFEPHKDPDKRRWLQRTFIHDEPLVADTPQSEAMSRSDLTSMSTLALDK